MIDYKAVAARIREERRLNKHVSQEEMAVALGMYQADVSNLERAKKGSGIADLHRLSRIADYFGITPEDLIFGGQDRQGLVRYEPNPRRLKPIPADDAPSRAEGRILSRIFGQDSSSLVLSGMQYGPYRALYIHEALPLHRPGRPSLPLFKKHAYVFCDGKVVASMKITGMTLFFAMNQALALEVQSIMPWRVFDFSEIIRRVNPFVPLIRFERSPEKLEDYQRRFWERLEKLRPISSNPIAVVESAYVREDFRRLGICRLMLDGLAELLGPGCSFWLNLEPTDDEDLEKRKTPFPALTTSIIGQMSMNAHIAERLGFQLENDLWTLKVRSETPDGRPRMETRKVRKVAFRLSKPLAAVLAHDEELVEAGRLLQKLAAMSGDKDSREELDRLNATASEN